MNRDPHPRFTVIIPTKDRAEYLHHSLRTCSMQAYDNLEVIVSDDGSRDHTRDVVEDAARKDPRIRYVTPGKGVGMRDNFEFAIDQAKPGYLIALGGDDGILPYGVEGMARALHGSGLELLAWPAPAFFYPKVKMETAQLVLPRESGDRIVRSQAFLDRQVEDLFYVADVESPMFYVKGVTSTELVERVRSRSVDGRFYACATPDGYSGIVLAGEVEHYAFSAEPFTLHGVSPSSAGVGYLAKNENAKMQSEAFFKSAASCPMHEDLARQPYSPLIALMTADYLLTARDLPGWPGKFNDISYSRLLAKSLDELVDGLFSESRVSRELSILYAVAEHHGLESVFSKMVASRRRNNRTTLEGNAISPKRAYVNASQFQINDLVDAAYAARLVYQVARRGDLSTVIGALWNSVKYRLQSLPLGPRLPHESKWLRENLRD